LDVQRLMVKIRYAELPAGLHVTAQADRRGTIVYLLPGLTPAQRRAALIRVRSSARMGHGPKLPVLAMAIAIAADRLRTTTRIGAAAMRGHPMVFLPPLVVLVSSAIVFTLMSFVTLTVSPHGQPVAAALPALGVGDQSSPTPSPSPSLPGKRHHHRPRRPAYSLSGHGTVSPSPSASASSAAAPAPHPSDPTPSPSGSPSPGSPSPSPSPSPQPSPSPSPSSSGMCVNLGSFGLCVKV
jgi:hypothetical protein